MDFDKNSSSIDKGNDNDIDPQQQQQQQEPYSIAKGREKRVHKAPQRYGFEDMVSFALITSSGDPLSYRDATNKKHNDKWLVATSKEMESLQKNKNWESAKIPKERRLLAASGYTTRKKHFQKTNVIYLCRRFTLMRMLLTC